MIVLILVPSTMINRDRDNSVTAIPVLVPAVPHVKRDGTIYQTADYDIAVRILTLTDPEALLIENPKTSHDEEFQRVGRRQQVGLLALLRLTQAVQTRNPADLKAYLRLESADEISRWVDSQSKLRSALGARNWPKPKRKDVEAAQESIVRSVARRIRFPLSEIARQLNARLRQAKFVIWWVERERKFAPGIFCEDAATAFAALLVAHVASPEGLGVCERCGTRFSRKKRIQRYCSLRCGNAARKSRQRAGEGRH